MRRAPLRNPCLQTNFAMAVWCAQAAVKFPHPDNWRERGDWTWYLRDLHLRFVRQRRVEQFKRSLLVDERDPNENAGTRPALDSTMRLGSPWFDGR